MQKGEMRRERWSHSGMAEGSWALKARKARGWWGIHQRDENLLAIPGEN